MKKILAFLLTAILSVGLIATVGCAGSLGKADAYVALDINPSIELVIEDGVVIDIKGLNYDAQVMLYGNDVVGKKTKEATNLITKLAIRYGYIGEDNTEIGLTVEGETEQATQEIYDEVSNAVTETVDKDCGIKISIGKDTVEMITRELEKLKEQYPNNEKIQNLNIGRYRTIKSAMEADGSLTIEVAVEKNFKELKEIIKEAKEVIGEYIDDTYELAVAKAKKVYDDAVGTLLDATYVTVDPIIGLKYSALRSASRTLRAIEDIDGELAEFGAITKEHVEEIAELLGLNAEETQAFLDSVVSVDGHISEDSVEYYLDKLIRNVKNKGQEAYRQFNIKLDKAEEYLDWIEDGAEKIPESARIQINSIVNSIKLYVRDIEDELDEIEEFDDLDDVIEAIDKEIKLLEKYFDENLTAEEKEMVQSYKNSINEQLASAKKIFDDAVKKAKEDAKKLLEKAQQDRLASIQKA